MQSSGWEAKQIRTDGAVLVGDLILNSARFLGLIVAIHPPDALNERLGLLAPTKDRGLD
jgi:hypothetical protein